MKPKFRKSDKYIDYVNFLLTNQRYKEEEEDSPEFIEILQSKNIKGMDHGELYNEDICSLNHSQSSEIDILDYQNEEYLFEEDELLNFQGEEFTYEDMENALLNLDQNVDWIFTLHYEKDKSDKDSSIAFDIEKELFEENPHLGNAYPEQVFSFSQILKLSSDMVTIYIRFFEKCDEITIEQILFTNILLLEISSLKDDAIGAFLVLLNRCRYHIFNYERYFEYIWDVFDNNRDLLSDKYLDVLYAIMSNNILGKIANNL